MTKYLTEEKFIVTSNDRQALKNYADNYDRIFGPPTLLAKGEPPVVEECSTCGAQGDAPCDDEIHEETGKPREV